MAAALVLDDFDTGERRIAREFACCTFEGFDERDLRVREKCLLTTMKRGASPRFTTYNGKSITDLERPGNVLRLLVYRTINGVTQSDSGFRRRKERGARNAGFI